MTVLEPAPSSRGTSRPRPVVLGVAVLMVAAQLGVRAWALYPSWFYTDDYRLAVRRPAPPFGWRLPDTPFDNQFMPLGRPWPGWSPTPGTLNWHAHGDASSWPCSCWPSLACLWMLVTVFGARWGVLVPLAST